MERINISEDKLYEPGCYLEEINDYFNELHISDGCPSYRQHRPVTKMLEYCPFDPDMVLWREIGPTGKM